MQEASLEGVNAHDDLSVMAEALLNHQLVHHLLLDVDVAILQGQHHGHELLPQILADDCLKFRQCSGSRHMPASQSKGAA